LRSAQVLDEGLIMTASSTIGLALSGGGARGLAHLGVLQVLEEAGVPVDVVAGTSMGGIVACLYAAGIPIRDLIAFSKKVGIADLASPDPNWCGLFGHEKTAHLLADLLSRDDIAFEDLDIPAAVVCTDIQTGELVILRQGLIIPAMLATSAFPIIFSPVHHQGRWLVDGGVLNNLPVDVVRRMGAERVVGVNLPADVDLSLRDEEMWRGLSLRRLRLLSRRILDWRRPLTIGEVSASISIQAIDRTRLMLCPPDLLLDIRLPEVRTLSNGNGTEVEAGRRVAMAHLEEFIALKRKPSVPRWRRRLRSTMGRLRLAWMMVKSPEPPLYPSNPAI
jgi:NTE family protein